MSIKALIKNFSANHPVAFRRIGYVAKGMEVSVLMIGSVTGINLAIATVSTVIVFLIFLTNRVAIYHTRKKYYQGTKFKPEFKISKNLGSKARKLNHLATHAKIGLKNAWFVTIPIFGPIIFIIRCSKNPPHDKEKEFNPREEEFNPREQS